MLQENYEAEASAEPVMNSGHSMTTMSQANPRIVYFSSVTENTKTLVERLSYPSERIPLRRTDDELIVDYPYILFVPSYGSGVTSAAVPKQVVKFLNVPQNRNNCIGIVAAGNINFGEDYCIAGRIIETKLQVPIFYKFELRGAPGDLERIEEGVQIVFDRFNRGELSTSAV